MLVLPFIFFFLLFPAFFYFVISSFLFRKIISIMTLAQTFKFLWVFHVDLS